MTVHALHQLTAPAGATPVTPPPQLGDAGAARTGLVLMPDEARRIDDRLADLRELVVKIDVKLETLTGAKDDHERRIRAIEQWRWVVTGAALVLGGTAGGLVSALGR